MQNFLSEEDIIKQIDSLEEKDLMGYSNFCPQDLRHYLSIQRKWLEDEIYFLGVKLNRKPSQKEISENPERDKNAIRFRAFYCLKFPDKVKK
jgi:hypothetical protein